MTDQIERQRAEIERLTRERDEARYFLKIFLHAHASNNAVPPHLEEQARKALADAYDRAREVRDAFQQQAP